eukprot:96679_1
MWPLTPWVNASYEKLKEAEAKLFRMHGSVEFEQDIVNGLGTVSVKGYGCGQEECNSKPPLVLIHGYGAGNAFWTLNHSDLSRHFNVYLVEMYGCGRSVRGPFNAKHPEEAEDIVVSALEGWRKAMGFSSMLLVGHSLGAMFSSAYALRHPEVVKALVLASPVGVGPLPENWEEKMNKASIPMKLVGRIWRRGFLPLSPIRWAGPWGRPLTKWIVTKRAMYMPPGSNFKEIDLDVLTTYVYNNWALHPSGEKALSAMLHPWAYARKSLTQSLTEGQLKCPCIFIYGSPEWDWMNSTYGIELANQLRSAGGHADVYEVPDSGHQVFLDNPSGFNDIVLKALRMYNNGNGGISEE